MIPNSTFTGLTAEQLRSAAEIKDRIEGLERQLVALLEGGASASGLSVKKRGRPPGSGAAASVPKKKQAKRKMSAEGRARIVAAQKKRWAAVKKANKNG